MNTLDFSKIESKDKFIPQITAVDLFCGAGGLTKGLEKAGIKVALGVDIDPACQFPYSANNKAKFLLKSVEDLMPSELQDAYGDCHIKMLAGCAPCQTFSKYNQKADSSDDRWWLLLEFSRLVRKASPHIVTMENVPGLVDQDVFDQFRRELEEQEYYVTYQIVDCAEYGLPQQRSRLVLLASKLGEISLLAPGDFSRRRRTVRGAIGRLAPIEAGGVDTRDPLHQSSSLTDINMRRIIASTPGGSWKDWPQELVAECHKRESGKTYGSVYGRMGWNGPSPTITTQFYGFGNGRFGHPDQNRAISIREGAILQSFPRTYKFTPPGQPIHKTTLGRLIGNAVPPKLGELIGKSILRHVMELEQAAQSRT
jgi:DNA (cytosine-5)-methyltransferase 1